VGGDVVHLDQTEVSPLSSTGHLIGTGLAERALTSFHAEEVGFLITS